MRGKKAKQLRRLTEEHTVGMPLKESNAREVLLRYRQRGVLKGTYIERTALLTHADHKPVRMANDCTRRQYQLNKRFYSRMRRGEAVFHG